MKVFVCLALIAAVTASPLGQWGSSEEWDDDDSDIIDLDGRNPEGVAKLHRMLAGAFDESRKEKGKKDMDDMLIGGWGMSKDDDKKKRDGDKDKMMKGMEEMFKGMMDKMGGEKSRDKDEGGVMKLYSMLADAHDKQAMKDEDSSKSMDMQAMENLKDMLELYGGEKKEKEDPMKALMAMFGGMDKDESSEEKDNGWDAVLELFGMGDMGKKDKSKEKEDDPMKALMAMFGGKMDEDKSKSKDGDMMKDLMEMFGGGKMEDKKDMKEEMMEEAKEKAMWLEKAFMALLNHRMAMGDIEGIAKMMMFADEFERQDKMVESGKVMSSEEVEKHFEMLFMKAVEAKAEAGNWDGIRMMMEMAHEWKEEDAEKMMMHKDVMMQMHAIYMMVLKHRVEMQDWEGAMNMMDGALLTTAYDLQDPMARMDEETRKGHDAFMMMLKHKAESEDWKGVVQMMKMGREMDMKRQKEEYAHRFFYFAHLLLGGDPELSEWADEKEGSKSMEGGDMGADLKHMMYLMEAMSKM